MKLQLTKKEIKAVKDSIEHWEKDIRNRLLQGDSIIGEYIHSGVGYTWSSDNSNVKMYEEDCALCLLVKKKSNIGLKFCTYCPYRKKHGISCTDMKTGAWNVFTTTPTLNNCNKMIEALEKILK